jgi:hypothetical protein
MRPGGVVGHSNWDVHVRVRTQPANGQATDESGKYQTNRYGMNYVDGTNFFAISSGIPREFVDGLKYEILQSPGRGTISYTGPGGTRYIVDWYGNQKRGPGGVMKASWADMKPNRRVESSNGVMRGTILDVTEDSVTIDWDQGDEPMVLAKPHAVNLVRVSVSDKADRSQEMDDYVDAVRGKRSQEMDDYVGAVRGKMKAITQEMDDYIDASRGKAGRSQEMDDYIDAVRGKMKAITQEMDDYIDASGGKKTDKSFVAKKLSKAIKNKIGGACDFMDEVADSNDMPRKFASGMKYHSKELRDLTIEGTVDISGTVTVDDDGQAASPEDEAALQAAVDELKVTEKRMSDKLFRHSGLN